MQKQVKKAKKALNFGNNAQNTLHFSVQGEWRLSEPVKFRAVEKHPNHDRERFLEPEVVILIRTAARQPPRQRLGLGRLSGKCYTGKPTESEEACLISIAVGSSAHSIFPAFCQDWREQERQPRLRDMRFPEGQILTLPV